MIGPLRLVASLGMLIAITVAVWAFLESVTGGGTAPYFPWLFGVLRGDLGWSPSNSQPVSQAIAERLPATIELLFFGFAATIMSGALIGFARARARRPILRGAVTVAQLLCRAMPVFFLVLFLQLLLIFSAIPLPLAGISSVDTFDLRDRLAHLIVPMLCLAVPFGAWSSLLFYDLFRGSDDNERLSIRRFARTVAAVVGLIGPALLSAGFLVELIVAWPGLGRLFFNGLSQRDFALVAGILLIYSVAMVMLRLCAVFSTASPPPSANDRKRFSPITIFAFAVLFVVVAGAVAANLIAPVGPYRIDQEHWVGYPLAPGVAGHILGTEENGRDLLSRLLVGARISLGIAASAAIIAAVFGAVVARVAKVPRWFEDRGALSLIGIRAFAALPLLLVAVEVLVRKAHSVTVLTPLAIALLIAILSWPAIVPAFRTFGPATLGGIVDLTACALLLEVTISLYGYGVQPPVPTLGNLLANAQSNTTVAPWAVIIPAGFVIVTLFALYAIGDELREMGNVGT